MRYQLIAPVQSNSYTVQPITVETPDFIIVFKSDTEKNESNDKVKIKNSITISAKIVDYEQYLPKLEVNSLGKGHHSITVNNSMPIRNEMIEMLHYLESMGTFWFGVRKIDLNKVEENWVPESEEEKKQIQLNSWAVNRRYQIRPEQIDPLTFAKIVAKKKDFDHMTVPLAFYRVGEMEFQNFNYYLSFFSFFLFLDSLFGEGKFKTDQLIEAFKKSDLLKTAIESAYRFLEKPENEKRKTITEKIFTDKNKNLKNVDNVIEFLISTRGELFHFSLNDTREKIHMLNQEKFEPVSFLVLMICVNVVVRAASDSTFRNQFVVTNQI